MGRFAVILSRSSAGHVRPEEMVLNDETLALPLNDRGEMNLWLKVVVISPRWVGYHKSRKGKFGRRRRFLGRAGAISNGPGLGLEPPT